MSTIPKTAAQRWDEVAETIKEANGEWVRVVESANVTRVRERLTQRGLNVEVTGREGNGSRQRPWKGLRIFARTV